MLNTKNRRLDGVAGKLSGAGLCVDNASTIARELRELGKQLPTQNRKDFAGLVKKLDEELTSINSHLEVAKDAMFRYLGDFEIIHNHITGESKLPDWEVVIPTKEEAAIILDDDC